MIFHLQFKMLQILFGRCKSSSYYLLRNVMVIVFEIFSDPCCSCSLSTLGHCLLDPGKIQKVKKWTFDISKKNINQHKFFSCCLINEKVIFGKDCKN